MSNKRDLLKLRDQWYLKLLEDGFKDIETHSEEKYDGLLKRYDSLNNFSEAQIEYYEKCRAFLLEFNFPKESHRIIWELHASGMTERNIIIYLVKHNIDIDPQRMFKTKGASKGTIYRILKKYKVIMKESIL